MNQWCKVCDEPAAGFHFGAFTCEGCKSFFGRAHTNPAAAVAVECKAGDGRCVIDKKNRTACKACRLKKCLAAGMSKSGSRYGRRSNWFKVHCLLQQHQRQRHRSLVGRENDRNDRCGSDDDDDDDENRTYPADPARPRAARPRPPFPLRPPQSPTPKAVMMPLLCGFAPKSRAPLPRSERSAFRETARPGGDDGDDRCGPTFAGHDDDDDDRPIDLTVRQKFARDDGDDNNNETAGKYGPATLRLYNEHDTAAAPLDLTRSDVRRESGGVRS